MVCLFCTLQIVKQEYVCYIGVGLPITSCLPMLSWQPNFITVTKYIHYFEHSVVQFLNARELRLYKFLSLFRLTCLNPPE